MIKLTRLALALAVPLLAASAPAPASFLLEGFVTDRQLGTPLANATVALLATGRSVSTDEVGHFTFRQFRVPGPDQIVVSHPAYRTARVPLGDLDAGAWYLEITLLPQAEAVGGARPDEDQPR